MAIRLIHCADLHLGSRMDTHLSEEKAKERRRELLDTFRRLVNTAKEQQVAAILMAGDMFDSDSPSKEDKSEFYRLVETAPDIIFFYLRGNHDRKTSYTKTLPNLKLFSDTWTTYELQASVPLTVSGIELSEGNADSFYDTLSLDADGIHIVMLHGQIGEHTGKDAIQLSRLGNKHIDYLALGHVHKPQEGALDSRGRYRYSGCLEGRGFDETGPRGYVMLTLADGRLEESFVPFASRTLWEYPLDLSDTESAEEALTLAERQTEALPPSDSLRLCLTGQVRYEHGELADRMQRALAPRFFSLSVKDGLRRVLDPALYENDRSLRGAFIREVKGADMSEEDKDAIIELGLRALLGEEKD